MKQIQMASKVLATICSNSAVTSKVRNWGLLSLPLDQNQRIVQSFYNFRFINKSSPNSRNDQSEQPFLLLELVQPHRFSQSSDLSGVSSFKLERSAYFFL